MSLSGSLAQIAIDALPTVLKLLESIAESGDQKASADRALRALTADAADAATDEAIDRVLSKTKGAT